VSYLSLYSIPPAWTLAPPLLTDSNDAWTACRQRLLVPVAVLLALLEKALSFYSEKERAELMMNRRRPGAKGKK
jgi:hypothetical protein